MQDEHLVTVREKFGEDVRTMIPLYDNEVRGVETLRKLASALFS
jgi:hypothetical protein